jgi:hypothetical protein
MHTYPFPSLPAQQAAHAWRAEDWGIGDAGDGGSEDELVAMDCDDVEDDTKRQVEEDQVRHTLPNIFAAEPFGTSQGSCTHTPTQAFAARLQQNQIREAREDRDSLAAQHDLAREYEGGMTSNT